MILFLFGHYFDHVLNNLPAEMLFLSRKGKSKKEICTELVNFPSHVCATVYSLFHIQTAMTRKDVKYDKMSPDNDHSNSLQKETLLFTEYFFSSSFWDSQKNILPNISGT